MINILERSVITNDKDDLNDFVLKFLRPIKYVYKFVYTHRKPRGKLKW